MSMFLYSNLNVQASELILNYSNGGRLIIESKILIINTTRPELRIFEVQVFEKII